MVDNPCGITQAMRDRAEENMKQAHKCPRCGRMSVWREGTGIWSCTKCKYTYTGGTYLPQTPSGKTMIRTIRKAVEGSE